MRACFDMITTLPARLMNAAGYGIAVGHPADLVVLDSRDPAMAVAELAQPLFGSSAAAAASAMRPRRCISRRRSAQGMGNRPAPWPPPIRAVVINRLQLLR